MPIRAENRPLYPANWKAISQAIRARAGNVCEKEGTWTTHQRTFRQRTCVRGVRNVTILMTLQSAQEIGACGAWHMDHPELADGEVWIGNMFRSDFTSVGWTTKRLGKTAYLTNGKPIPKTQGFGPAQWSEQPCFR